MKKIAIFAVIGQIAAMALVVPLAGAQSVSASASVGAGVGQSGGGQASPAIIVSPPMPIAPPPTTESGFTQFNDLTVESVSATNPPAEILATYPTPVIVPMIYNGAAGTSAGASAGTNAGSAATAPSTAPSAGSASSVTCYRFDSENSATGKAIACPVPLTPVSTPASTSVSVTAPAATAMPMIPASTTPGTNGTAPAIYPYPYPIIRTQAYRIEVDASTELYLRDRTPTTLSDFAAGDQINVFGYYNTDGSIQAYLVRDLSKPAQSETLQLNNADLISISAQTVPATLVVAQQSIYPCYGFGASGNAKQSIACPMGVQSSPSSAPNSALQNIQVPSALVPIWNVARKYVVNVDAQTILLDSNRTKLQLSDLRVGDELNVYGETSDNGQTLNADIVRDLSIPATPQTYSGTVTQVNGDGSFIIHTNDNRDITVQNIVQPGALLQLTGLLNRLQNALSQVTSITTAPDVYPPPAPVPMQVPGMLRVQGGNALPPAVSGTPNTQN